MTTSRNQPDPTRHHSRAKMDDRGNAQDRKKRVRSEGGRGACEVVSTMYGNGKKSRTTRFRHPSQDSPVILLCPDTRNVKTECDRDERWFINVEATDRLDCARVSSEATCEGPDKGTV
jgi:hypothetical protein